MTARLYKVKVSIPVLSESNEYKTVNIFDV